MDQFGSLIVELRGKRGMSTRCLAQRCGISAGYLSRLERGGHSPTVEVLQRLAGGLRISLFDLMLRAGYFNDKGGESLGM